MPTTTISSSVPSVTFSTTGLDVPDEGEILAGRLSDMSSSLGTAMSKELTTPQGQIAVSDTAIIADKNDQLLAIINNINPDFSSGKFQDGIGRLYFLERIPASGTIVTCTCTGSVGSIIPAGSMAEDEAGYLYGSLSDATIGADGSVMVEFQNQTTGPIPCSIGALKTIYKSISGWSSVSNAAAGVLGADVEGRANFEYRRRQSVAGNANNQLGSIYASVLAVPGVTDAYVTQNNTENTVNKGATNFPLAPHALYVAVYGGAPEDIATAIFKKLPPGPPMMGNNTYTVYDDEHYVQPYPDYQIKWQTPAPVNVYIRVELADNNFMPSDIDERVKDAVTRAFTGEDGGTRARIASSIYAGRYYAGITEIDPDNVDIFGISISTNGTTYSTSATFGIDQIPTLDRQNIQVTLT